MSKSKDEEAGNFLLEESEYKFKLHVRMSKEIELDKEEKEKKAKFLFDLAKGRFEFTVEHYRSRGGKAEKLLLVINILFLVYPALLKLNKAAFQNNIFISIVISFVAAFIVGLVNLLQALFLADCGIPEVDKKKILSKGMEENYCDFHKDFTKCDEQYMSASKYANGKIKNSVNCIHLMIVFLVLTVVGVLFEHGGIR